MLASILILFAACGTHSERRSESTQAPRLDDETPVAVQDAVPEPSEPAPVRQDPPASEAAPPPEAAAPSVGADSGLASDPVDSAEDVASSDDSSSVGAEEEVPCELDGRAHEHTPAELEELEELEEMEALGPEQRKARHEIMEQRAQVEELREEALGLYEVYEQLQKRE